MTVRVGRPFRPAELLPPGTDRRTAKGLVTTMIMERIAALLPPAQRGAYGGVTLAGDPRPRPTSPRPPALSATAVEP